MDVHIRLLGPVEAVVGGAIVDLRGARQRRLLAKLAMRPGIVVDGADLIDAIWPDGDLPADARETLRTYASRLRACLGGAGTLAGRAGGYALVLAPGAVDGHHFESLLSDAAGSTGAERLASLDDALALWHGPALAGFDHEEWARPTASRWTEQRDTAVDDRAELLIELGRHEEAVAALESASHERPLRERTHRLLMAALQLGGRQGEALRVYERFRRRLATDLGLDPGEEIRELESRIAEGGHGREGAPLGGHLRGYRVLERIGDGAFSVVYRGEQPAVGRPVAIKVIRAELANRADFVRRFEAEAHLVARLEHPHIVPLYDYWREPGSAYLVMRLLSGTLEDRLHDGPMALPDVVRMLTHIGSALAVAHRAGVVHRDVKPANIFCDTDGNFFLGDFGIAFETAGPYQLGDLSSVGSPAYAPPEQLRREPVGPSADAYGLAVVVYEALTGELPFPGARSQADLLRRRLTEPLPHVRAIRTDVPAALDQALARATAKDPGDRYLTIDDMVDACRGAIEGRPATVPVGAGRATLVTGVTRNPYKGLRAFQEADSDDFFGRQRLVDRLLARLIEPGPQGRLVTVVGPSGSGKSSVVRAGLLPAVRADAVPGSSQWFVTSMIPGAHPFEELEAALRRVATGFPGPMAELMAGERRGIARVVKQILPTETDDVLLVIDQFEELFTLCADDGVRRAFIDGLVAAVSDPRSRVRVILTLRADFYDRPLRYPDLAPLIEGGTVAVSPLTADELERAIIEPAARSGATFEPGLVARIIADFVDQPGALPLLQYAMTELFDDHVAGVLTVEAYERLGGLTGVLGRRAEVLHDAFTETERSALHRVMTRLVSLGEGTEDTRRRVRRSELASDAATLAVIESFGDARLLSFDHDPFSREPTIEVAHEALIREWPRLRSWLDDDRDGLRVHRHLTEVATGWSVSGRDEGELLRGARLETTATWAAAHDRDLNDAERELLAASQMQHRAELDADRERVLFRERQNRRLRRSLAAVALVAALAVVASVLAVQQRGRADDKAAAARRAADEADIGRIQSEAAQLSKTNPRMSLLLAAEAYRRAPGPESLGALQYALVGSGDLLGYIKGGTSYGAVAWIDAHRFAAARDDGVDIFGDDGKVRRTIRVQRPTLLVTSPDGGSLAVGQERAVTVVDLRDEATTPKSVDTPAVLQALRFAPDGAALAVGTGDGRLVVHDLRNWPKEQLRVEAQPEQNVADLRLPGAISEAIPHVVLSAVRGVSAITFVPGTEVIATAGFGYARLWDRRSGQRVGEQVALTRETASRTVATVALSMDASVSDGRTEVVVAERSTAWRIDAATGSVISTSALPEAPSTASLGDDDRQVIVTGRLIVTDYQNGATRLVDIDHAGAPRVVDSTLSDNYRLAVDPGQSRLVASSRDGLALVSLRGDGLISRAFEVSGSGGDLQVTSDGAYILLLDVTESVAEVWQVSGPRPMKVPLPDLRAVTLTRDDHLVVTLDEQLGAQLVELPSGRVRATLDGWPASYWLIATDVSPDGTLVALSSRTGIVQVRSTTTGAVIHEFKQLVLPGQTARGYQSLGFDPTGNKLIGSTADGHGVVWELATGKATTIADGGPDVIQARFTPDGRQVTTLGVDGTVTMRDANTYQPNGMRFVGNTSVTNGQGPYFSPDGRFMVTTYDFLPKLWDLRHGQQIGGTFPSDATYSSSASFDMRWAVTGRNGRAIRWDLDVDRWPDIACRAAGRNMTLAEWSQLGPSVDYVATCPQFADPSTQPGATS